MHQSNRTININVFFQICVSFGWLSKSCGLWASGKVLRPPLKRFGGRGKRLLGGVGCCVVPAGTITSCWRWTAILTGIWLDTRDGEDNDAPRRWTRGKVDYYRHSKDQHNLPWRRRRRTQESSLCLRLRLQRVQSTMVASTSQSRQLRRYTALSRDTPVAFTTLLTISIGCEPQKKTDYNPQCLAPNTGQCLPS